MTRSAIPLCGMFRDPRISIVLALLLFPLHHLVGLVLSDFRYTPFSVGPSISSQVFDETQAYAPGARRFYDTGALPSEMDLYELREKSNGLPLLHALVAGSLARLTGSLENAWMLLHALLPALSWWLLFLSLDRSLRDRTLAIATSWVVLLAAFAPRNSLLLAPGAWIQPLELTRFGAPCLSFPLLLLAIYATLRAIERPSWRLMVVAGVSGGALFYAYYFHWLAFFIGTTLLMICTYGRGDRPKAQVSFQILLLGTAVGAPYLWSVLSSRSDPGQAALMNRVGEWHAQGNWTLSAVGAAAAGWAWYRSRRGTEAVVPSIYLLALIVAGCIGANLHLATGYDAQHLSHFTNKVLQPLLAVGLCAVMGSTLFGRRAIAAFAVLIFCFASARQIQVGQNTVVDHRADTSLHQVLQWLKGHTTTDSVLGSVEEEVFQLAPAVAGRWNFVPMGCRTMASNREILERYFAMAKLHGRELPSVLHNLRAESVEGKVWLRPHWTLLTNASVPLASREIEFTNVWQDSNLAELFQRTRLDYILTREEGVLERARSLFANAAIVHRQGEWKVIATNL